MQQVSIRAVRASALTLLLSMSALALAQPPDGRPERPAQPADPRPAANAAAVEARAQAAADAGLASFDANRYADAIALLNEAYLLDPEKYGYVLLFRGQAKLSLADCAAAISDFDAFEEWKIVSDSSAEFGLYTGRAACYSTLGNFAAAVSDLETHVRDLPEDADAWASLGDYRGRVGRDDDALAAFRKSMELDPENPHTYAVLGGFYKDRGNLAAALDTLLSGSRLDPDDALMHILIGVVQAQLGHYDDARASLREGLRLDPSQTGTADFLAMMERDLANAAAASTPNLQRSAPPAAASATPPAPPPPMRVYPPVDPRSALGRGVALYRERDMQPALAQLLAATAAEPNDARGWVFLADTYRWLGLESESQAAFATALKLDPNILEALR